MLIARYIIAAVFALLGLAIVASHYWIWIRKIRSSLVPLLGGGLVAVGLAIVPLQPLNRFWWVPPWFDPGCWVVLYLPVAIYRSFHPTPEEMAATARRRAEVAEASDLMRKDLAILRLVVLELADKANGVVPEFSTEDQAIDLDSMAMMVGASSDALAEALSRKCGYMVTRSLAGKDLKALTPKSYLVIRIRPQPYPCPYGICLDGTVQER